MFLAVQKLKIKVCFAAFEYDIMFELINVRNGITWEH